MALVPTHRAASSAIVKAVLLEMVLRVMERMTVMFITQCMASVLQMERVLLSSLVSNVLATLVFLEMERPVMISMSVQR